MNTEGLSLECQRIAASLNSKGPLYPGMKADLTAEENWARQLCATYAAATPNERQMIRILEGTDGMLVGWLLADRLAYSAGMAVRGPEDEERVREGLIALAIEDMRGDFRDWLIYLDRLERRSRKYGIPITRLLVEVAELANPAPSRERNTWSTRQAFLDLATKDPQVPWWRRLLRWGP